MSCSDKFRQKTICGRGKADLNCESKRKFYNLGTCRALKGSVYALMIYLDDDVSSWSHTEITYGCAPKLKLGLEFLSRKAGEWNTYLKFRVGNYYTDFSEGTHVRYSGCVESDIVSNPHSADILQQAARSVGFSSIDEFHKYIKKFSGEEQVMYFIVLNKEGRSYAMSDMINDGRDYVEYCVLFAKDGDEKYDFMSFTAAHETLHLFGAEDYYDPYHKFPKRRLLASRLYPDDIMLCCFENINSSTVGAFTAYSVGWTDRMPKECDTPEWWE